MAASSEAESAALAAFASERLQTECMTRMRREIERGIEVAIDVFDHRMRSSLEVDRVGQRPR